MWEKMCDYCLDISKYCLTAVFVATLMTDLGEIRWLLYTVSLISVIVFMGIGFYCHEKDKKKKEQKRNKYKKFNNKNRRL